MAGSPASSVTGTSPSVTPTRTNTGENKIFYELDIFFTENAARNGGILFFLLNIYAILGFSCFE